MRYIECGVNNEFVSGAGQVIGAAGSHHAVAIRMTFSDAWAGLTKRVLWIDAKGTTRTETLLTADLAETESVYVVPIPAAPLQYEGKVSMTVYGVELNGTSEVLRLVTKAAFFDVMTSYYDADSAPDGPIDIDPTIADQMQAEIDAVLADILDAREAAKDAEAWAVGQIEGADVPETDERYENNSKYYAQRADESAAEAYSQASAAFGSAAAAAGSAATATDSATASANSAAAASTSETNAAASADNAAGSATAAAGSATAAATSASAAAGSEANAAGSETAAQESADYVAEQMTKWNQKADQTTVNLLVKSVTFNAETGVFTITREDGSYTTIDTALEKVATNWQYDADTQSLVLTLADGSTQRVPLSAFITETEFTDSAQIAFSVNNHLVTATVKSGSITEDMLSVAFMGTIRNYVSSAAGSASAAATSASAAAGSATGAATSAASAADSAEDSEAWAVGQRGGTDVPSSDETYHNNAKYWAGEAQHAAQGGVSSFNGRSGTVEPQSGDYTAALVGARPDTWMPTAEQVGADASGAAAAVQTNLNTHANNTTTHITAAERTAWSAKAGKVLSFTVTLTAAGWSSNAQTVSNANFIVSGYSYVVTPMSASLKAYAEAQVYADDVTTAGQMTFHCEDAPSGALTVNVIRMEVQ